MTVLDTHVWLWWLSAPERLSAAQRHAIEQAGPGALGVSAISCWEVAKLVQLGRIELDRPVGAWLDTALAGGLALLPLTLLPLTLEVAVASTQLPGTFHRDPADELIVATARVHGGRLVTSDRKILAYEHVASVG